MERRYRIAFTLRAYKHLEALRRHERNAILDAIKAQLVHSPVEETRNRKLLRNNPLADWELRAGRRRVFYDVDPVNRRVRVLAIGIKDGNRLIIEGKEVVV